MIRFETIDGKQSVGISREKSGAFYEAKLSALVNSSDMSVNADRGQDFGWRLDVKQRAQVERWKKDPETVAKVSEFSKVPVDNLNNANYLMYMLHLEERGKSAKVSKRNDREKADADYKRRVAEAEEAGFGIEGDTLTEKHDSTVVRADDGSDSVEAVKERREETEEVETQTTSEPKQEEKPTKKEMLANAKERGLELEVTERNTVAEIESAIEEADQSK